MTKISIEKRVYSERIGSEKPISTFQSRIACGQNPMVEHPSNLFLPLNSPIINICKSVSAINSHTVCYEHKMSDGARRTICRMSDGARILAGFARSVSPFVRNFAL